MAAILSRPQYVNYSTRVDYSIIHPGEILVWPNRIAIRPGGIVQFTRTDHGIFINLPGRIKTYFARAEY